MATTVRRYGGRLVDEGFFSSLDELQRYAEDLERLEADATRRDIAWRLGLDDDVLDPRKRRCEISNWLERQVKAKLGG